jgi:hypothetical protein
MNPPSSLRHQHKVSAGLQAMRAVARTCLLCPKPARAPGERGPTPYLCDDCYDDRRESSRKGARLGKLPVVLCSCGSGKTSGGCIPCRRARQKERRRKALDLVRSHPEVFSESRYPDRG